MNRVVLLVTEYSGIKSAKKKEISMFFLKKMISFSAGPTDWWKKKLILTNK